MNDKQDLYVELVGGGAQQHENSQMLEIIRNLHHEMVQIRTSNECLLQASNEQERLIRELTSRSSHHSENQ